MSANVERAAADLDRYAAKEMKLVADLREAIERVSAAELSAGDSLLDAPEGESPDAAVEQIVRARSAVAAIEASLRACRARRRETLQRKIAAEAAIWRGRGDETRTERARLEQRSAKHLDALRQLEGVEFIPASTPKSSVLGARIVGADDKAAQLEAAGVPLHGGAQLDDVTSVIPLVDAVLRHASDGPSAQDVLAWAAACDPDARFGDHLRSFRVTWRDGVIDYRESYCQVAALAPSAGVSIYTLKDLGPDMAQAIFRAPASLQPPSRRARPAVPAAEPEMPPRQGTAPTAGGGITAGQYLGYEAGRRWSADAADEGAQA